MYTGTISISDALTISVFSIVVVFIVLLALVYLVKLNAVIIQGRSKKQKQIAKPTLSETNDKKKIAVVAAAAISAYLDTDPSHLIVKRIIPLKTEERTWEKESRITALIQKG